MAFHDAVHSHYQDTVVIDDPDCSPHKEIVVQALTMGVWHKLMPDHSATSCGVLFNVAYTPLRRESLDVSEGDLCGECFTAHERDWAEKERAKVDAERAAPHARKFGTDWKNPRRRR